MFKGIVETYINSEGHGFKPHWGLGFFSEFMYVSTISLNIAKILLFLLVAYIAFNNRLISFYYFVSNI